MEKQTMGTIIAAYRKKNSMTQLELAEKMGVTDKAVSKWERDLACPDIASLPQLAEILGLSVDELMQTGKQNMANKRSEEFENIINIILKAVPLAMGVGVFALSLMKKIDMNSGLSMLGIGMACMGIASLRKNDK